jgi:cytochrome c2
MRDVRMPFYLAVAMALAPILTIASARAAGDRALGEYLSSECVTCHQLSGKY